MTVRAETEGGGRAVPGHERAHPGQVDDAHGGGVRRKGEQDDPPLRLQGTRIRIFITFKFIN